MLDLPLWLLVLFGALFGAGVWPWMLYVALFAAGMCLLGLLGLVANLLGAQLPLPTPIARATGRDRRRPG